MSISTDKTGSMARNAYFHRPLQRLAIIFTVLCIIISSLAGLSAPASAESSASVDFTYSEIQRRIRWLKNSDYWPFRAGSVWDGSYSSNYTDVYDNGSRVWDWQTYKSKYCQGFARMAFDVLFLDRASTARTINYTGDDKISSKIAWMKANLRPGDYLCYGGHVLIFYDMDSKRIYAYDNNHGSSPDKFDRKTYFETMGWTDYRYCDQGADTIQGQIKSNPGRDLYIVRSDAAVTDDWHKPSQSSYTAYVTGTDGSLVINSKPSAGYGIAEMPEYSSCTVYPDKSVGNWKYVSDGVHEGYSYGAYLKKTEPSYVWGQIHNTDGSLCINRTPSTKYRIYEIPEGAWCKVYTQRRRGNWVWVCYNGVYGWSYRTYIRY